MTHLVRRIVCAVSGHQLQQMHLDEPLSHYRCQRCEQRFFDARLDDGTMGYCPKCWVRLSKYGLTPGQMPTGDVLQQMVNDGYFNFVGLG